MKKKTFIISGLLLASLTTVNAQETVFSQGFEEAQSSDANPADTLGVGWYQFINTQDGDSREPYNSDEAHSGSYSCYFSNAAGHDGFSWERAIKFRNLPMTDATSYRLTFYTKGDNEYSSEAGTTAKSIIQAGLMAGIEYADMSLLGANSTGFAQALTDINSYAGEWNKHTVMAYFVNYDWNNKVFLQSGNTVSSQLPEKYFVTLNIYSPGDYYLDDVSLVKSEIAGTSFCSNAIKVNFGYNTNLATLCNANDNGRVVYDNSSAAVTVNGTAAKILSVEAVDGNLYIFLDQSTEMTDADEVKVSFTNPTDADKQILYTGDLRPRCDTEDKVVRAFTEDVAYYDENCVDGVESSAFSLPILTSADPDDNSFDLPTTTRAFSMTFDKPVNAAKATMSLYNKVTKTTTKLTVSPASGYVETITGTADADVAEGLYAVNANKIVNEENDNDLTTYYMDTTITVTVGTTTIEDPDAKYSTVWSEYFTGEMAGTANVQYPVDWTIIENGKEVTGIPFDAGDGGDSSNHPSVKTFTSPAAFSKGFVIHRGANSEGTYYVEYGNNKKLTNKPGDYQLTYEGVTWCNWGGGTDNVKVQVINSLGTVIAYDTVNLKPRIQFALDQEGSTKDTLNFSLSSADYTGGNWTIRFVPVNDAGLEAGSWSSEVVIANIDLAYKAVSMTDTYKANIAAALATADSILQASSAERYTGEAYNNLNASYTKYKDVSFTSPSAISLAIVELKSNATTLINHKTLCDTYDPLCDAANVVLFSYAGQKYANTPSYPALQALYDKYNGKVLTDDTELQTAIDSLTHYTSLCENMCGGLIDVLTKRINKGLAVADILGVDNTSAAYVNATNAITDDYDVANALNDAIRAKLYSSIGNGTIDFSTKTREDEVLGTIEYTDSFDMSSFIKNPQIYVNSVANTLTSENVPGWTISGNLGVFFTDWANSSTHINAEKPVGDDCVLLNWYATFSVSQEVTDLPVGVYNIKVGYSDTNAGAADNLKASFFYYTVGGVKDSIQCPYTGSNGAFENNVVAKNVNITDGNLKLEFTGNSGSRNYVYNAALTLVNKVAGFDYTTGMDETDASSKTLKSVSYYNANGSQVGANEKGFNIVKKTYTDGSTKVGKVINK